MSRPIIALVALTLVSSGASAYFWKELRTERASTQALGLRIAQLEKAAAHRAPAPAPIPEPIAAEVAEPATAPQRVESKAEERGAASSQATYAVVGPGAMTMSAPRVPNADMRRRMQEARAQQRRLMQDPEYRELMRAQQKLSMNHMYGDLELMLDLDKEQSERLRDLIAEQQMRQMENQPAFAAGSDGPPDPAQMQAYRQRAREIQRKNDDEIAALLGPKYAEWQTYQQNSAARMQVMQLRQALATSDEPLRPDQVKPLVEAVAQQQKQLELETRSLLQPYAYRQTDPASRLRMQEEWLEHRQQTNEHIRTAAGSLLSPSQLERLAQQQEQEIKMQQVHLKMQRAQEEARARGELPADGENAAMLGVNGAMVVAD